MFISSRWEQENIYCVLKILVTWSKNIFLSYSFVASQMFAVTGGGQSFQTCVPKNVRAMLARN